MSTTRVFSNMLNEHLHYDLMMEELTRRNYLLEKVERDDEWVGGPLPVPFEGSQASSIRFGKLTQEDDVDEFGYVRGVVNSQKEVWGTMQWWGRDLIEHDGTLKEKSFLRDLPGQLDRFIGGMKDAVSVSLLQGAHFNKLTADSTANDGVVEVDRIERLTIGQKVQIDDSVAAPTTAYVRSIDINANTAVLYDARTGGAVINFSATNYTVANNAKLYYDDAQANNFTSLREQLLSAANGGSATLFGQTKLAYPYLQALNHDGSGITSTNFFDQLFDFWTDTNRKGKGHATHAVMSYKHLGTAMKLLESGAGAYRHIETKASVYGYTEIVVLGVKGQLTLVGIHEMEDDVIYLLDWSTMKFHTNGGFRKHVDPDGNNYYTIRTEDGYKYLCDICVFGEFIVHSPSRNGVIYGIDY
jgi:hypothetical protein